MWLAPLGGHDVRSPVYSPMFNYFALSFAPHGVASILASYHVGLEGAWEDGRVWFCGQLKIKVSEVDVMEIHHMEDK